MQSVVNWEELGIVDQDRRHEARIVLLIPIEITGFDTEGRFFAEATYTIDVSKSGCGFLLGRRLGRGAIVAIKILGEDGKELTGHRPLLYQIARARSEAGRWVTGAAKLQPRSIWTVAFPE